MKYFLIAVLAIASLTSVVSASTGSTSTGTTAPALTCLTGLPCAGGPTRGWNSTTKEFDMVPQCFPWTWYSLFLAGDISGIYENQTKCRAQRFIDFGV